MMPYICYVPLCCWFGFLITRFSLQFAPLLSGVIAGLFDFGVAKVSCLQYTGKANRATRSNTVQHILTPIPQAAELVFECIIQAKHGRAGRLCPMPGGVTIENCYLSLRMQKPNVRWEPQAMKPIGELEAERPISAGQTEGEKEERRNTDLDMIRTLKEGRTTRLAVQLLYVSGGLFVINYPATNDVQSSQAGSR